MTRIIRPCSITYPFVVNDGKPFDARTMDLSFHIFDKELNISNYDEENGGFIFYESFKFNTLEELENAKYNVQWQLGEALNSPVLATKEVLEGFEDFEPQFLVDTESFGETSEPHEDWVNLTPKWAEPFLDSPMFPMSDEEEWCYMNYAVANGSSMYKHEWEGYEDVVRVLGCKIKSNECPQTLEYLLQFYTDGTLVKRKEDNDGL